MNGLSATTVEILVVSPLTPIVSVQTCRYRIAMRQQESQYVSTKQLVPARREYARCQSDLGNRVLEHTQSLDSSNLV